MTHVLHCGDCLDPVTGLASLPDKSISAVITDPPYSAHVHESCRSGLTARNKHKDPSASKISIRKDLGFASVTAEQLDACAAQFARLAKRWVMVFSDVESCHLWRAALVAHGLEYIRTLAWVKHGGSPQFTGDRPAVGFETLTLCHPKGRKRWNGGGRPGVYTHSIVLTQRGAERLHETQKPESLMEALIRDFTEPSDVVLDPFCGSGTTGVGCRRLGRSFIGYELDACHAVVAEERIAATKEQLELPRGVARWKQASLLEGCVEGRRDRAAVRSRVSVGERKNDGSAE